MKLRRAVFIIVALTILYLGSYLIVRNMGSLWVLETTYISGGGFRHTNYLMESGSNGKTEPAWYLYWPMHSLETTFYNR